MEFYIYSPISHEMMSKHLVTLGKKKQNVTENISSDGFIIH